MRLRQLVIATNKIEVLADNICDLFELKRTFSDPELIVFGLENILIPLGDTFIELVTPVKENTSAERFLKKRGGDGGYMVIVDAIDLSEEKKRLEKEYEKLIKKSFEYLTIDRKLSDLYFKMGQEVLDKINKQK